MNFMSVFHYQFQSARAESVCKSIHSTPLQTEIDSEMSIGLSV